LIKVGENRISLHVGKNGPGKKGPAKNGPVKNGPGNEMVYKIQSQ